MSVSALVLLYLQPETLSAPLLFEKGMARKISQLGGFLCGRFRNLAGRGNGAAASRRAWQKWSRVWVGGFAKLYFCSFPNVVQSARRCMWEKDSEADSFSHIHLRTACTPLGKTAKASQIRPPKLTTISVKALLEAAALLPHPVEFRKLCIADGRLRYFSLRKRVANPILFWMFKIVFCPKFISLNKK